MMLPRGEPLLLPVYAPFIWGTLALAFLISMAINIMAPTMSAWMPDLVLVSVMFWAMHQPRYVGVSVAFTLGLFNDVQQSALLGQHAFIYSLAAYFAIQLQRRLAYFSSSQQAIQLLPMLAGLSALQWLIRWLSDSFVPTWPMFIAPIAEVCLWPLLDWVLLAPQRRPPDQDDHRPL